MPAFYAHNEFGKEVMKLLPEDAARFINDDIDLFYLGLQGPDIFFYYHNGTKAPMKGFGSTLHNMTGREFFSQAVPADKAGQIYLSGVLCHFTLDALCHKYIWTYNHERNVSHEAIEGEFEGYVMAKEGKDRLKTIKTLDFFPSEHAADAISKVYDRMDPAPSIDRELILKALNDTKQMEALIRCPNSFKRNLLYLIIKLAGKGEETSGHIIPKVPGERFYESNEKIYEMFENAIPKGAEIVTQYVMSFQTGTEEFFDNPLLNYDFEGDKHSK